jgi:hypothetical protein
LEGGDAGYVGDVLFDACAGCLMHDRIPNFGMRTGWIENLSAQKMGTQKKGNLS